MPQILHVIDQPGELGRALELKLSFDWSRREQAQTQDPDLDNNDNNGSNISDDTTHAWLLLGGEAALTAAKAAGIPRERITLHARPRPMRIPGAMRGLRRVLRQADRLICWTPGAAELVQQSACGKFESMLQQKTLSPLSRALIQPIALTMRERWDAARSAARGRWAVPDSATAAMLPADWPERVDVRGAVLAAAFVRETLDAADSPYRDLRLIAHPDAMGRMTASELARLLEVPDLLIQDAGALTPWLTLPGCDLVLSPQPRHAGLSLAWAEAFGLPIIAAPEPTMPLLAELDQLRLAKSRQAKHLSLAITDWAESRTAAIA